MEKAQLLNIFFSFLGSLVLTFFFQASLASARDSSLTWQTLETKHFEIIYNTDHISVARDYAQYAETAYDLLIPIFKEAPDKTIIVIDDSTDEANGWARVFPYPVITVYPVLPIKTDSLSEYKMWGLSLVIHEYTHILNLYPRHGFYVPLKYIFGSLFYPNQFLPLWYQEGLAVEMETQLTDYGRLRSSYYNAMVRALVKDDAFMKESIDRANERDIPEFPYGARPYFFGSLLWNKISKVAPQSQNQLNQNYSRRFPYFITAPIHKLTHKDYHTLFEEYKSELSVDAQKQIEKIKQQKISGPEEVLHLNSRKIFKISPNNKNLIFNHSKIYEKSKTLLVQKNDFGDFNLDTTTPIAKLNRSSKISWFKDSKSFVYDKVDTVDRYYNYSDLYLYNIEKKKGIKLTHGLRAQDPVLSAHNKAIAFIQNSPQGHQLSEMIIDKNLISLDDDSDLDRKNLKYNILYKPAGSTLSSPIYINENKIVFIERLSFGKQSLAVYDKLTQKVKSDILENYSPILSLKKSKYGFLFSSDVSGVPNIYFCDLDFKNVKPLTNTDTYIKNATLDTESNTLYFDQLTSNDFVTFKMKVDLNKKIKKLNRVPSLIHVEKNFTPYSSLKEVHGKTDAYSSTSYLLPRYIIPYIYSNENGVVTSLSTSGSDPLNKQMYSLGVEFDSYTQKGNFQFIYLNRHLPFDLSLLSTSYFYSLAGTEELVQNTFHALSFDSYVWGLSNDWRFNFSTAYQNHKFTNSEIDETVFNTSFAYNNLTLKNGFLKEGYSADIHFSHFVPNNDINEYSRTALSGNYVFHSFLPTNHAIFIQGNFTYAPELELNQILLLGSTLSNGNYYATTTLNKNIIRGYPYSEFIGKNYGLLNLEYHFPIKYYYKGKRTLPYFFKRLKGAITYDQLVLDGAYYHHDFKQFFVSKNENFSSLGVEIKLDTNVGYHFPLSFLLGIHYGFVKKAGGETPTYILGMTLPSLL